MKDKDAISGRKVYDKIYDVLFGIDSKKLLY